MSFRVGKLKYWKRNGNKYNARRGTCSSNHSHPSQLEVRVCDELALRKKAGDIKDYEIQKRVRLVMEGLYLGTCIPDFYVTNNDGTTEFLEAKGMEMFKWKRDWKILQHMYKDDPSVTFRVIKR